jgi:CO/xanthine dehydrogenase FAD-binding subunit
MKPPLFQLTHARSVDECVDLLADHDSDVKVIAGGQSLMPLLNLRLARPERLVDINKIPGLAEVDLGVDALRIGALARHRSLETSEALRSVLPIVPRVVAQIGHLAIRNRGSIGGSLAHGDSAAELPALMTLLEATIGVTSAARGRREVAIDDLFLGPLMTTLSDDELLTDVAIPWDAPFEAHGFFEHATRVGDFARVAALMKLRASGDEDTSQVTAVRFVLFGSELASLQFLDRAVADGTLPLLSLGDVTADPGGLAALARQLADEILDADEHRGDSAVLRRWARVASDRVVADLVADMATKRGAP